VPTFTQSSDGASHFESPAVTDAEVLAGPVSLVDPEVLVDPVVLVGPEVLVGPVALLDAAALAAGVSAAFAAVKSRQAMAPAAPPTLLLGTDPISCLSLQLIRSMVAEPPVGRHPHL
jgi:hypothetical protein